MRAQVARRAPRFQEVLNAFVKGIGLKPEASLAICIEPYQEAYRNVFHPFTLKHPHILENYILNQMFRIQFPLGRALFVPEAVPEIEKAYELLVIQFALVKGLLIGAAGHYRDRFCADHVVKVVQTVTRHFEHDATFLSDAHELLKEKKMNTAQGLTMLVRN
jgi:lysine-N-methylase